MNNMKVISFNAVKEVIISSVEIPGLNADEILVEIEYSFVSVRRRPSRARHRLEWSVR